MDKIDWFMLSLNTNAIRLLEQNLDKIDWIMLSYNPNTIHLLEQNLNKINWEAFSMVVRGAISEKVQTSLRTLFLS
jgi:hypothetical protein